MNLLKDDFISTTQGKVSLKTLLTSDEDYHLQYYFDEIQLAMLQLLSSLATVVLQPTIKELKGYCKKGLTAKQYDEALENINCKWFSSDNFMQSTPPPKAKWPDAPITKLLSGIECGTSGNSSGLFSEIEQAATCCPDCMHALNYNLHMNIKGECFGPSGATGIRGGGAISTLIAGENLKQTVLYNTIAHDFFNDCAQIDDDADETPMWITPLAGIVYQAPKIGLVRGLFALAYHIAFNIEDKPCICDVCGSVSQQSIKTFNREKYKGAYGSTKNGRDAGAGWWLHPYTPSSQNEKKEIFAVCARDQHWQSWQELSSYIIGKETNKSAVQPAYVVKQLQHMKNPRKINLLIGGNIADQGGITGRVYDLYSMPSSLDKNLSKVTQVIDSGLEQKERLSSALNKIFAVGYDKNFISGIKESAMFRFTANAQQIIQRTLLDVDRKEASELREVTILELQKEARDIFMGVQRKYQHDIPLFKALVKGEASLYKK